MITLQFSLRALDCLCRERVGAAGSNAASFWYSMGYEYPPSIPHPNPSSLMDEMKGLMEYGFAFVVCLLIFVRLRQKVGRNACADCLVTPSEWAVAQKDPSRPPITNFVPFYLRVAFNMKASAHKSHTRVAMKYTVDQKH